MWFSCCRCRRDAVSWACVPPSVCHHGGGCRGGAYRSWAGGAPPACVAHRGQRLSHALWFTPGRVPTACGGRFEVSGGLRYLGISGRRRAAEGTGGLGGTSPG